MALQKLEFKLVDADTFDSTWNSIIGCLFYKWPWVTECQAWYRERGEEHKANEMFDIQFDKDNVMSVRLTENAHFYIRQRFDYLAQKAREEASSDDGQGN
jgi:hypothetical protein